MRRKEVFMDDKLTELMQIIDCAIVDIEHLKKFIAIADETLLDTSLMQENDEEFVKEWIHQVLLSSLRIIENIDLGYKDA